MNKAKIEYPPLIEYYLYKADIPTLKRWYNDLIRIVPEASEFVCDKRSKQSLGRVLNRFPELVLKIINDEV